MRRNTVTPKMAISPRVVARSAAVIGAITLLSACHGSVTLGTSKVDNSTVESQVASQLASQAEQPTPTVTCPDDLDAKVNATETCTLMPQGSSETYNVTVTVTSVSNGTAHFSATVAKQPNS